MRERNKRERERERLCVCTLGGMLNDEMMILYYVI